MGIGGGVGVGVRVRVELGVGMGLGERNKVGVDCIVQWALLGKGLGSELEGTVIVWG